MEIFRKIIELTTQTQRMTKSLLISCIAYLNLYITTKMARYHISHKNIIDLL